MGLFGACLFLEELPSFGLGQRARMNGEKLKEPNLKKRIKRRLLKDMIMKILATYKFLFPTLLLASLFFAPTAAQDTAYRRVLLVHDISVEIPSHWKVLSQETRNNLRVVGEALTKNAGIESSSGKKVSLLAVNATPDPTGAMIRLTVTYPPDYTQADLVAATPADLKDLDTDMQNMVRKLEASGSLKIIEMQPVRVETLNNYHMLVMPYVRASINGPSPWQVTQYKIPASDRLIEITLSHRQSDAVLWQPILEHVKRSVQF